MEDSEADDPNAGKSDQDIVDPIKAIIELKSKDNDLEDWAYKEWNKENEDH